MGDHDGNGGFCHGVLVFNQFNELFKRIRQAIILRDEVVELKATLKQTKKEDARHADLQDMEAAIRTKELEARDLEARASAIDAAVFDLKAVNLNTSVKVDDRSPAKIIEDIEHQGKVVTDALKKLQHLLTQ